MPPYEEEGSYETSTDNFKNVSGDGTTGNNTDLVVVEVDHRAQVSNLRITGANSHIYDLVVRDQDGSNESIVKTLVGSDIDEGTFRDPALRNIGAQREVALVNRESLSDANYGISIEVDEVRRGVEG